MLAKASPALVAGSIVLKDIPRVDSSNAFNDKPNNPIFFENFSKLGKPSIVCIQPSVLGILDIISAKVRPALAAGST